MAALAAYLKPDHFGVDAYRAIYKLSHAAWKKRQAVLTEREILYLCNKAAEKVGPVAGSTFAAYIKKVYAIDVTAATYDQVVESITRTEFASLAADAATMPVDEFMSGVKGKVEQYHPLLQGGMEKHFVSLDDGYLAAQADELDDRQGIPLGFGRIDAMVRGNRMLPGEMVEILALTNGGKTAFMVGGLAWNMAVAGNRVVYFSLDVAKEEIETRFYARLTGRSMDVYTSRRDMARMVAEARDRWGLRQDAFTVVEAPAFKHTVDGLKQMLRNIVQTSGPVGAVFVDYGQQVKSTAKYDKQYAAAGEVFSELHGWAVEDDFVLVTAAQVHRKAYDEDVITMKNIADGFNMTWPAQLILSINQTPDEKKAQTEYKAARIALLKNTKGRSQMIFPFKIKWETMEWEDDVANPAYEIEGLKQVGKEDRRGRSQQEESREPLIRKKSNGDWKARRGDDEMDVSAPPPQQEEGILL